MQAVGRRERRRVLDLYGELRAFVNLLRGRRIEYALCGGLAMAVHALPRATVDIDVMIQPDSLEDVKAIARDLGYSKDVGLLQFQGGAVRIHRLAKTMKSPSFLLVLDLILVTALFKNVWEHRETFEWENESICVVSARGLMEMKQVRDSEQDRADIVLLRSRLDEG